MLLTRSPLSPKNEKRSLDPVRLACVKHAASVHPEPGSNSPTKTKNKTHQKTAGKKQSNQKARPKWFKPENNPAKTNTNNQKTKRSKIISIKKTKNRKNQNTQPNSQAPQSIPHKQNKKNTLSRTQTTKPQTNQKRSVKVVARKTRESQSNRFDFRLSTYF